MDQTFKEVEYKKRVAFIDTEKNSILEDVYTRFIYIDEQERLYHIFSIGKDSNVFFIKEFLDDPMLPTEMQYRPVFDKRIREEVEKRLRHNERHTSEVH